eukprot:4214856-Amphidinium_carterae.3
MRDLLHDCEECAKGGVMTCLLVPQEADRTLVSELPVPISAAKLETPVIMVLRLLCRGGGLTVALCST